MVKEILTIGINEIKKKTAVIRLLAFLEDVDIEKVLVSNKISVGEKIYKYFIGYLYNDNNG